MLPTLKIKELFSTEFYVKNNKKGLYRERYILFSLEAYNKKYTCRMYINPYNGIKITYQDINKIFNILICSSEMFNDATYVLLLVKAIKNLLMTLAIYNIPTTHIKLMEINNNLNSTIYFKYEDHRFNLNCTEKKFFFDSNNTEFEFESYGDMIKIIDHCIKTKKKQHIENY